MTLDWPAGIETHAWTADDLGHVIGVRELSDTGGGDDV